MSLLVAVGLIAALAAPGDCDVEGATLDWGFKESFRSYISGTIANGEWTVADGASYETPTFGWADGSGVYDAGTGELSFPGSITFTGHGDILNTTVANPQLRFVSPEAAVLLLDVTGTTQEGEAIDAADVEFATLDLRAATVESADGVVTITGATATLTPDGAEAFGTYEAREPLDPISVRFATACPPPASAGGWVIGLLAAITAAGAVVVAAVVRRRRQAAGA